MKKIFFILSLFASFICFAQSNAEVIASLKRTLPLDEDFKMNAFYDRRVLSIERDSTSVPLANEYYLEMAQNSSEAQTVEELIQTWNTYHIAQPETVVNLLQEKIISLEKVVQKFPEMSQLTSVELRDVLSYSYSQLDSSFSNQAKLAPGCNNQCCNSYVGDIDDCDTNFAIGTAFSIVGGLIGGFFGSPIVGSAIITSGIGAAYASHEVCRRGAVRDYRDCMGYN